MRFRLSLFFPIVLLSLSLSSNAQQLWSGVLPSTRATDWTQAGFPGDTLPSASWTQCGSTINAYSGSASTINNALSSCGANQYVLLGAGTFNINGGQITFPASGHVVLRGSGANSTFIVIANGAGSNCGIASALICIQSSDQPYFNQPPPIIYGITSGYSQGSTSLTLSGTGSISATNPTILFIEQCETGLTANSPTAPCTGTPTDNGQLFICSARYSPNPASGCSADGPGNENTGRGQFEATIATGVSGNVVTVANPIKYPNYSPAQAPRVWIQQPIVTVGVENMAFDDTSGAVASPVAFFGAYQWWVSGCKFTNWADWAVEAMQTLHGAVKDSYFYHSTGADSYAIRFEGGSYNLVQNNIITQVFAPLSFDGPSSGDVVAYNFVINDNYLSDYMRGSLFEHAVNAYDLFEGNVMNQQNNDGDHGTANMITRFRNFSLGWDSCANGQCGSSTVKDSNTNALFDAYGSRYENNIANVTGEASYHTTYEATSGNPVTWIAGSGNGGVSPSVPLDSLTYPTSVFWGNYDTVNNAVLFCTAAGVPINGCGANERANAASTYPGLTSPSTTFPPSFYMSSKPSWWGSLPWPAIGPDVSNGNVGRCTGTLNTARQYAGMPAMSSSQCTGTSLGTGWGGHVNANPAMNCYLGMGGTADGTGGVLAFDAGTCYGTDAVLLPSPPTGLTVVVQ